MAVMDEFKEERAVLKNGTPRQKFAYFWEYYRWHVIISVAVVAFLVSLIYEMTHQKEDAFYGVFINSFVLNGSEDYMQGFADKLEIDTNGYKVSIDNTLFIDSSSMDETTLTSAQKLMVYIAASEIDVIAANASTFEQYANSETFADLRNLLSAEQLAKYEPYLYYVDQKVVDEKQAAQDVLDESYVPVYPDPTKPEDMEKPVPIGVYITNCESLQDAYYFTEISAVMGIVVNTQRPEEAVAFIEYVLGS